MDPHPIAHLQNATKSYVNGDETVSVLRGVDFSVYKGDFIAIMGASGSGKSTFLHILGCLDRIDGGSYFLNDRDIAFLNERKLSHIRRNYMGFIFQEFNLLPQATVYENVALPFLYSTSVEEDVAERIHTVLKYVGLSHRLSHHPAALSGGERQRVAIARAVVTKPKLILADEPTGNLDARTTDEILDLFQMLHGEGASILLVSHDLNVARRADKLVTLRDGKISEIL